MNGVYRGFVSRAVLNPWRRLFSDSLGNGGELFVHPTSAAIPDASLTTMAFDDENVAECFG